MLPWVNDQAHWDWLREKCAKELDQSIRETWKQADYSYTDFKTCPRCGEQIPLGLLSSLHLCCEIKFDTSGMDSDIAKYGAIEVTDYKVVGLPQLPEPEDS